jgi:hypothetical protein
MAAVPAQTGLLALTFGTLLSSQGTDAHRSGSLDPSWGNLHTVLRGAVRVKLSRFGPVVPTRHKTPLAIVPCERCRGIVVAPGPAAWWASVPPWGEGEH